MKTILFLPVECMFDFDFQLLITISNISLITNHSIAGADCDDDNEDDTKSGKFLHGRTQ